jgi:aryl-alcohol dehydrogenase-like predicted oxidoreductase
VLGVALAGASDVVIASKVGVTWDRDNTAAANVSGEFRRSVDRSLMRLRRDRLDLLQLHSATERDLEDESVLRALDMMRAEGLTTCVGATVYGERAAQVAMASGVVSVVQVAFSLLDQRPLSGTFPEASRRGIGIVTRSAWLKGALTSRWRRLPAHLGGLRRAVVQIVDRLGWTDGQLAETALRFCLSQGPPVASVLIGVASSLELNEALTAAAKGVLPPAERTRLLDCAIYDELLLDPSSWPEPA